MALFDTILVYIYLQELQENCSSECINLCVDLQNEFHGIEEIDTFAIREISTC